MDRETKVLLIEDDPNTRRMARMAMAAKGYRVLEADSVASGLRQLFGEAPDLVVIDLELPDGSGLDVCRKVREHPTLSATPLVLLTGHGKLEEKLQGFDAGADQYLVKPLDPLELGSWVEALLKRAGPGRGGGPELIAGELTVLPESHLLRYRGREIADLTPKEFDLLAALVKNRPRVLSRQFILSKVWKTVAVDNLVDTHLWKLRKKLPAELADRIQAIPGRGFRYLE